MIIKGKDIGKIDVQLTAEALQKLSSRDWEITELIYDHGIGQMDKINVLAALIPMGLLGEWAMVGIECVANTLAYPEAPVLLGIVQNVNNNSSNLLYCAGEQARLKDMKDAAYKQSLQSGLSYRQTYSILSALEYVISAGAQFVEGRHLNYRQGFMNSLGECINSMITASFVNPKATSLQFLLTAMERVKLD